MLRLIIIFLSAGLLVWLVIYSVRGQTSPDTTPPSLDQIALNNLNVNTPPAPAVQRPSFNKPFAMSIDKHKKYTATITTTAGNIVISLNAAMTPNTVNNFVELARKSFYDGTIFHRVIKGFMIQGGDPEGNGTGGPGYRFADEPFSGDYNRGTVAMANAGPNTNGSQFFIMHASVALPKNYVIFGQVLSGLEVVDAIANASVTAGASGEGSTPISPITVSSVTIEEK